MQVEDQHCFFAPEEHLSCYRVYVRVNPLYYHQAPCRRDYIPLIEVQRAIYEKRVRQGGRQESRDSDAALWDGLGYDY